MSPTSLYSVLDYGSMVNDRVRTDAFVEALKRHITDESVVLDIGTGSGFFALLACQLGARAVHAVEPDEAIEVGRACARNLPGGERITWYKSLSTDIELPERADIILGDLHGTLPLFPGNIESFIDARKRHLRPGGRILPARDRLWAVPAQAPHEYERITSPWECNRYGVDMSAGRPFGASTWWRARKAPADPADLLSAPQSWGVVDYAGIDAPRMQGDLAWTVERPGTVHGYYAWFDAEVDTGLGYSNAPQLPELVYGRGFFPLERPVEVVPGDRIDCRLDARLLSGDYLFRWHSRVRGAGDEAPRAEFKQSTFNAQPLNLAEVHRLSASHVPELGGRGRVDLMVLSAMAESVPLGRIAAQVAAAFPERFATEADALRHVAALSGKYSG